MSGSYAQRHAGAMGPVRMRQKCASVGLGSPHMGSLQEIGRWQTWWQPHRATQAIAGLVLYRHVHAGSVGPGRQGACSPLGRSNVACMLCAACQAA